MLLEQMDGKLLAEAARIAEDKTIEHALEDREAEKEPMTPHVKPDGVLSGTVVNLVLAVKQALQLRPDMTLDDTTFLVGVVATGLIHGIRIGMEYEKLWRASAG